MRKPQNTYLVSGAIFLQRLLQRYKKSLERSERREWLRPDTPRNIITRGSCVDCAVTSEQFTARGRGVGTSLCVTDKNTEVRAEGGGGVTR